MAEQTIAQCAACGKVVPIGRRYCCEACYHINRKAKSKRCVNCDCEFSPIKWFPSRGKYASANSGKTCSRDCARAWISNNQARKDKISLAFTGDKHPNWQGGKAQLNNVSNRGPGWQAARRAAINRDNDRCRDCGMSGSECKDAYGRGLDVDHITPFHNFNNAKKANALTNLQCLCASCHKKAESIRTGVQMMLPFGWSDARRHKSRAIGQRHPKAKLTDNDVRTIRARAKAGERAAAIAKDYPVDKANIFSILRGKIWRNLL